MRYRFVPPDGWIRAPFPPPARGVYLRAPVDKPGPESASILLHDVVLAAGSLDDQLGAFVKQGCEGAKVVKQQKPTQVAGGLPGLTVTVQVQVTPAGGRARDELRVFALLDAAGDRLPVSFIGGAKALAAHQRALDTVLASIAPLGASPYAEWMD